MASPAPAVAASQYYSRTVLAAVLLIFMILKMELSAGAHHDLPSASAALEHWAKTLADVPLPAQLRYRLSPLDSSTELIARYKDMISSGRVAQLAAGMCSTASRLYCSTSQFAKFRQILAGCGIQFNFRHPVYETDALGQQKLLQSHGNFFRESELVEGAHVVLRDQKSRAPTTSFLPRQLAELFQPLNAHLLEAAFSIPPSSLLGKESMQTSQLCNVHAKDLVHGEEAFCAFSLEDLADQLKAKVLDVSHGSSLTLLPVSSSTAASVPAKLLKVELQAETTQPYLACHAQTYPFAVHFCHHIPNTRIYSATLQSTQGELIDAIAVCHMDTSDWSPLHVAFVDLHSTPGHTEACHWTHENSLVFVPTK